MRRLYAAGMTCLGRTNADLTKKGLRLVTDFWDWSENKNERRPDEEGIETHLVHLTLLSSRNERRPDEEGIETE